jgi:hypothetical protein
VSDFDPSQNYREPATNSPVARPFRFSLKLLAAYAVAIVNGAALLYILVKILAALGRFLQPV